MKQQMALSRAVQENGPNENNRQDPGKADVGGSQTQNPLAEDVELEVFTNCSIYCIKYVLWRRIQMPIQNMMLTLPGQSEPDLDNNIEIRHILNYKEPEINLQDRKPSLQQFMSKPLA